MGFWTVFVLHQFCPKLKGSQIDSIEKLPVSHLSLIQYAVVYRYIINV